MVVRLPSKKERQRDLGLAATRLLRAADRRERAIPVRLPPPKARSLPPVWPDHLRLQDLGWVMKQMSRRRRHFT